MPNAEHCRALAQEADRLADVVSYTRDKLRLREQAESWRLKAQALETVAAQPQTGPASPVQGRMGWWLKRRA